MASERQRAVNRANALLSTGPTTPEGKAAVCYNAVRHGALAHDVVLQGRTFLRGSPEVVRANLSLVGPIEEYLEDRVVNDM
jgi:hypothetical protein